MQAQIKRRLSKLYEEKKNLEKEIALLEKELNKDVLNSPLNKDQKLYIFRSLFIARSDRYLKKWISKDQSKISYFPVTRTFKGEDYLPLTNKDIEGHLRGQVQLASYVIDEQNFCKYAVLKIPNNEIINLKKYIDKKNIEVLFEKDEYSDVNIWFFFQNPQSAKSSKEFLLNILKDTNIKGTIYPNQDFANSSNLGNFKPLPLHLKLREKDKTVFFDPSTNKTFEDQWLSLQNIKKISNDSFELLSKVSSQNEVFTDIEYPKFKLTLILFDYVYIPTKNLAKTFLNSLKELASFENPQVKLLLNLRKPLYNIPRYIKNFEEDESYLKLPRGLYYEVVKIFKKNSIDYEVKDKRFTDIQTFPQVIFTLRDEQKDAIEKIVKQDSSICVAPPGFGKTLIGAKMIELRACSTLILVNKNMLLDQWIQRFIDYLGLEKKEIGFLGKSKNRLNGKLDIATMQSLKNQPELIKNYSFLIVDECHHIPAVTFEQIVKKFCGKYILGLSATPNRKDALDPILFQQLGPISYEYRKKRTITHQVKVINTNFESQSDNYAQLINEICASDSRNNLIINEVLKYIDRKILILTDRIEHINILEELLIKNNLKYVSIHGSLSKKEQQISLEKIEDNSLILATTSYFGEGIDFPHLNTIMFVTPISYYGRLVQYLGRVGRDGQACLAIDFLDSKNAMLNSSFKKRVQGYKQMHYKIT